MVVNLFEETGYWGPTGLRDEADIAIHDLGLLEEYHRVEENHGGFNLQHHSLLVRKGGMDRCDGRPMAGRRSCTASVGTDAHKARSNTNS